jgi:LmbE family N-acetylglucosaminyl deacetylase
MLELKLGRRGPLKILCLGAHCDDIEIGCGGALLALLRRYPSAHVTWIAFSATALRAKELRASAGRFLRGARRAQVITHAFRDGFFPEHFGEVKDVFETLKQLPDPDLIFTHHRVDFHQDHRVVAELTWNTFRNHLILEYEIPKYEGGLTTPSAYIGLNKALAEQKIRILMSCYKTQRMKSWFTPETFRGLMRLRGIESGQSSGWAEGFHAYKALLA